MQAPLRAGRGTGEQLLANPPVPRNKIENINYDNLKEMRPQVRLMGGKRGDINDGPASSAAVSSENFARSACAITEDHAYDTEDQWAITLAVGNIERPGPRVLLLIFAAVSVLPSIPRMICSVLPPLPIRFWFFGT